MERLRDLVEWIEEGRNQGGGYYSSDNYRYKLTIAFAVLVGVAAVLATVGVLILFNSAAAWGYFYWAEPEASACYAPSEPQGGQDA